MRSSLLLLLLSPFLLGHCTQAQSPEERAVAAIVGSLTADAATMPLHWIYDTDQISSLLAGADPEFFPTPSCPFYSYPLGENSPYGQQTRQPLDKLAEDLDVEGSAIEKKYWSFYGAKDGECSDPEKCYHDGSTKGFVANHAAGLFWPECGANDTQANAIAHMVVVAAAWAGKEGMLTKVETVIRVTQNTDEAVAFGCAAARILEKVIFGSGGKEAVEATIKDLRDPSREQPHQEDADLADALEEVLTKLNMSNFDVVMEIGQSCEYPNNLISGAHLIAQGTTYADGVRQRILSGGDSASANSFNGAVLAALEGTLTAIPIGWARLYTHYDTIFDQAHQLVYGVRKSNKKEVTDIMQIKAELMEKMEEIQEENAALKRSLSGLAPQALMCAYNTGAEGTAATTLTYDRILSEHYANGGQGSIDIQSGVYTCLTGGYYQVSVSGLVALNARAVAWIYLHRNGQLIEESSIGGFEGGSGYIQFQAARTMTLHLDAGDSLELRTDEEEYFTGDFSYATFCVSLISADE